MTKNDKISEIKDMLDKLGEFRGSKTIWVAELSKAIGMKNEILNAKMVNDIQSNTIKFVNYPWNERIDIVHKTLRSTIDSEINNLQNKYQEKGLSIKELYIDKKEHIKSTEEIVDTCDLLFQKGSMLEAKKLMLNVYEYQRLENVKKANPTLYGNYYLVFANLQMQFGISDGFWGTNNLIKQCLSTFAYLDKEKLRYFHALNLYGHILRQTKNYKDAMNVFERAKLLIDSVNIEQKQKDMKFMNIQHQIALTKMGEGGIYNKPALIEEAVSILRNSNDFYEQTDDEKWYKFSRIREAELYIKLKEVDKAEQILGIYDDPCEISLLSKPRIAILHRINTERYILLNNVAKALKHFKTATIISTEEEYRGELKQLEALVKKYSMLQQNLPENFSVHNPKWI